MEHAQLCWTVVNRAAACAAFIVMQPMLFRQLLQEQQQLQQRHQQPSTEVVNEGVLRYEVLSYGVVCFGFMQHVASANSLMNTILLCW